MTAMLESPDSARDQRMRIELLGGLQVLAADRPPLRVGPGQTGLLLAMLALQLGRPATREWLVTALWPGDDVDEGRQRLRQALYLLRQELSRWCPGFDAVLIASRETLALDAKRIVIDTLEFESAVKAAESADDPADQGRYLARAISLYQGDLLAGFYHECFEGEQRRFSELYRSAYHALPLRYEAAGDLPRAIEAARHAVTLDPLTEETHYCLMRLYAAAGQPSAVLRQYRELERVLRDELDESPSPATRRLVDSLRDAARTNIDSQPRSVKGPQPGPVPQPRAHASILPPPPRRRKLLRTAVAGVAGTILLWLIWVALRPITNPRPRESTQQIAVDLPEPRVMWQRVIPLAPDDNWSEPSGVAMDRHNSIYVGGYVNTKRTDTDYLTQKISPAGDLLWQRRYNGTGSDVDRARALLVDADGNVVVTGESLNPWGNRRTRLAGLDIVTVKYDSDGRRKYAIRWNSQEDGEDRPTRIATDLEQNIVVAGSTWTRAAESGRGGFQMVCLKIDRHAADGSRPAFVRTWLGRGHLNARATDVACSRDDVVITGSASIRARKGGDTESVTLRLDPGGRIEWSSSLGGRATPLEDGGAAARLLYGAAYLVSPTILADTNGTRCGVLTTMLSPGGSEIWNRDTTIRHKADSWPSAAGPGPDGGIVVAAGFVSPGGNRHFCLVAFDRFGVEQWRRIFSTGERGPDDVSGLESDENRDELFVVGHSMCASGPCLMALKLRLHDGHPIWMSRSFPWQGGDTESINLALPHEGTAVVTGQVDVDGRKAISVQRLGP